MKKILFLTIFILSLTSCSKTEVNDNINKANKTENQNIQNTTQKTESIVKDDNSKVLDTTYFDTKKQTELNKELEDSITNGSIGDLDCNSKYSYEGNNSDDKKFILGLQKKCMSEKSKNTKEIDTKIKERIEAVNNFKIEKCQTIAKEKYAYMKDGLKEDKQNFGLGEQFSYEEQVKIETEYCEQAYAFQYGCELLLDQTKKQKCLDMKDFQKKYMDLERYQNFVIGTYLK